MKSGERRAAIIDAAVHLFAEKGFRGTTTRELASALGVTEPILYQHFHTKSDLYCAIIESKSTQNDPVNGNWRELLATKDDRAIFSALADLMLRRYEEDPDLMRLLMFSGLERHELADKFFERSIQGFFQSIAQYIQTRVDSGAYRPLDSQVVMLGFVGMINYHALLRLLFTDRLPPMDRQHVINEMVETFLAGVRNPTGG